MIENPNPEGGTATEIPFPGAPTPPEVAEIVKPNGLNVLLRLDGLPTMQGGIHLPQKMQNLEFITATVLAIGPECKFVKKGSRVLVAYKAIINGSAGIPLEQVKLFFTQENLIVAVIG